MKVKETVSTNFGLGIWQPTFDADRECAKRERARLLGPHARSLMNQVLALCRLEIYDEFEPKESTNDRTT
jgi:hypothetical protein